MTTLALTYEQLQEIAYLADGDDTSMVYIPVEHNGEKLDVECRYDYTYDFHKEYDTNRINPPTLVLDYFELNNCELRAYDTDGNQRDDIKVVCDERQLKECIIETLM